MKTNTSTMPTAANVFLAAFFLVGVFIIFAAKTNSGVTPVVGIEFQIEGFQKAKIIGTANSRAIVVLTNNVGQNSYEEMSFETVEMLQALPQRK